MARFLRQQLKIRDLRVIDAVCRHGSVLSASAELLLSQPAVSKSLRRAEIVFGTMLFERLAQCVRPTSSGWAVVKVAAKILLEVDLLEAQLSTIEPPVFEPRPTPSALSIPQTSVRRLRSMPSQHGAEPAQPAA